MKFTLFDNEVEHHKDEDSWDTIEWLAVIAGVGLLVYIIVRSVIGIPAHAQTATVSLSIPCNNQNWQYENSPCQSPPQAFNIQTWGFDGYLENGKYWKQTRITSSLMVFEMEQVKYLTDGKTIVYLD